MGNNSMINLYKAFMQFVEAGDYLRYDKLADKYRRSLHPDVNAFILLSEWSDYNGQSLIGCTNRQGVWFNVKCKKLGERLTEQDVQALVMCGVHYTSRRKNDNKSEDKTRWNNGTLGMYY